MSQDLIDRLGRALDAEHQALLRNDNEALLRANEAKLQALDGLQRQPPAASNREQLQALMERNRRNGVLLARRQRQVRWALRHLGRIEAQADYRADGRYATQVRGRSLGIG